MADKNQNMINSGTWKKGQPGNPTGKQHDTKLGILREVTKDWVKASIISSLRMPMKELLAVRENPETESFRVVIANIIIGLSLPGFDQTLVNKLKFLLDYSMGPLVTKSEQNITIDADVLDEELEKLSTKELAELAKYGQIKS